MVRWRYCLVLAMLLLLPLKTVSEEDDDEEQEDENDDENNEDEAEEEPVEKFPRERLPGRRAPSLPSQQPESPLTRTMLRRPLECYVCAYKAEMQQKSCLDPSKHRVHTMTCHNVEEKCFTSVISKGQTYETVMRGCRSSCLGTPEITCCELNRCNNQAFAMPLLLGTPPPPPPPYRPRMLTATSKSTKAIPHTVLFFVTVLLVLQTVVKVAVV